MSGLINELVDLLESQAENYENLLAIAAEKKDVIVSDDVDSLQKITKLENTIVGKNQRLEKKRLVLVRDIAYVLGKEAETLNLPTLLSLIEAKPEYPALKAVYERIKNVMEPLMLANEQNKLLIMNALDYIDFSMNVIRTSGSSKGAAYSEGKEDEQDRNIFFDAKQ